MSDDLGAMYDGRRSVTTAPVEQLVAAAHPRHVRRAILLLLAADIAFVIAHVGSAFLGYDIGSLNLDYELNVPTWFASAKHLAIAVLLALVALMVEARTLLERAVLLVPIAMFVALSIDETASIHERLGFLIDPFVADGPTRDETAFGVTGYWMFVLGPILAAAMVAIGLAYRRLTRAAGSVMRLAALGAAVFLVGATVVEVAANFVEHPFAITLQVAIEEGMELVGVTLMLAATMQLVSQQLHPEHAPLSP